jgi:N-carbamoyl-L-amino-acid hydrolase
VNAIPVSAATENGTVTGWRRLGPEGSPLVVLVHGANGEAAEWLTLSEYLENFSVLAIDLPAHGGSRVVRPLSLDVCVQSVHALLTSCGIDRAHFVGSSFGGGVALAYAAAHPDRVSTLTTMGTSLGGDRTRFEEAAAALRAVGPRAFFSHVIPHVSYRPDAPAELVGRAVERAASNDVETATAILEMAFCTSLESFAAAVRCPLLVLGGRDDLTCPPEAVARLAEAAGSVPLTMAGVGHLPHLEAADRIASVLTAFWRMPVRPERTIANLQSLRRLTQDDHGVQRLCWGARWRDARSLFSSLLDEIPGIRQWTDEAGNHHAELPGASSRTLMIGSHLDSVPDGGNLDGALGVMAGLEVLRTLAARGAPPLTVRLTDWADEEGARFGRSLYGSAAFTGALDVDALRRLVDSEGRRSEDVLRENGVDLARVHLATTDLEDVATYLELHIEQGPILENTRQDLAAVTGSLGVQRHRLVLTGTPGHAGGTPMDLRRDPVMVASRALVAARTAARSRNGLITCGVFSASPPTPTAIAAQVTLMLDVRHQDAGELEAMWSEILAEFHRISDEEGVECEQTAVWTTPPVHFSSDLVGEACAGTSAVTGEHVALVSGPLHDACEISAAGVPTVMLFVPSRGGVSHAPNEHTDDDLLAGGVRALAALTDRVLRAHQ